MSFTSMIMDKVELNMDKARAAYEADNKTDLSNITLTEIEATMPTPTAEVYDEAADIANQVNTPYTKYILWGAAAFLAYKLFSK